MAVFVGLKAGAGPVEHWNLRGGGKKEVEGAQEAQYGLKGEMAVVDER